MNQDKLIAKWALKCYGLDFDAMSEVDKSEWLARWLDATSFDKDEPVEVLHLDGGKYTIINDNGSLSALRNGEPWQRDLIGDKLVYTLFAELYVAREELRKQRPTIRAVFNQDVWDALDVKGDTA